MCVSYIFLYYTWYIIYVYKCICTCVCVRSCVLYMNIYLAFVSCTWHFSCFSSFANSWVIKAGFSKFAALRSWFLCGARLSGQKLTSLRASFLPQTPDNDRFNLFTFTSSWLVGLSSVWSMPWGKYAPNPFVRSNISNKISMTINQGKSCRNLEWSDHFLGPSWYV